MTDHPVGGTPPLRPLILIPALIIHESAEEQRLKDVAYNQREALAPARAIQDFLTREVPPLEEVGSRVSLPPFELTFSVRAFPESPVAGECHRLRADILARQGRSEEAKRERLRSVEHYVGGWPPGTRRANPAEEEGETP